MTNGNPTKVLNLQNVKTLDDLLSKDGPLKKLFKGALEQMLEAELTGHLGYPPHDPIGHHSGNSRNGTSKKTLKTSYGETEIAIPRDRTNTFEPKAVRKYQTTSNEIEDKIITLYGYGVTTRDIQQTLEEITPVR